MSCLICGEKQTDKCHIKSRGAGGTDDDWNILRMCRVCHTTQHKVGFKKLSEMYPAVLEALTERGWKFENDFGPWKLRRN